MSADKVLRESGITPVDCHSVPCHAMAGGCGERRTCDWQRATRKKNHLVTADPITIRSQRLISLLVDPTEWGGGAWNVVRSKPLLVIKMKCWGGLCE